MNVRDILAELPPDALLPVRYIRDLLASEAGSDGADLTVKQAGQLLGRSASSVRAWCASGTLEAYRFRGRQWRITREAIAAFQTRERVRHAERAHGTASTSRPADLASWRKVREAR